MLTILYPFNPFCLILARIFLWIGWGSVDSGLEAKMTWTNLFRHSGAWLRAPCRPLPPSGLRRAETKKDPIHLNLTILKLWFLMSFHLMKNFFLDYQIWFEITLYSRCFLELINFYVTPSKNNMISAWKVFL